MIVRNLLLSTCLILFSITCYSQTSTDSLTYLTKRQVKIINLAFNELDKYMSLDSNNTAVIGTKDKKIAILAEIENLRSNQLINANTLIAQHEKEIKKLKRQLVLVKSASIAAILGTIYLLK